MATSFGRNELSVLHKLTPFSRRLSFPAEQEKLFREEHYHKTINIACSAMGLGLVLNFLFILLDTQTFNASKNFIELVLEKIKTIGDCYMVAVGVPIPRADHAHALAALALEMQILVEIHSFGGKQLSLRFGINSRPVVAGIIGHKKFSYDLWGDTVNTASRMESQGSKGQIQLTKATYELIKAEFECEAGGEISVKF